MRTRSKIPKRREQAKAAQPAIRASAKTAPLKRVLDLVQEHRLRPSTRGPAGILIASESDKGRVINSAAFRRLQQKAQVFPLDPNAAVRTRLTHSIEVSQVGRHLAQKVIKKLGGGSSDPYEGLAAFVNTIETACLLHDIGNPPFGHFGELAIQEWFTKKRSGVTDLVHFDGNPQGFRLTSFLSGKDEHGLNLTCTLLLSTVKYPFTVENKKDGRKIGLFSSDYETYLAACQKLGWKPGLRFPLAVLMDTADDIAYATSDLEDALEKKIISIDDLKSTFGHKRFESPVIDAFVEFKTRLISDAVEIAARTFEAHLEDILSGKDIKLIPKDSAVEEVLQQVSEIARTKIYTSDAAEKVELAGRSVIRGLLDHFEPLLDVSASSFVLLVKEERAKLRGKGLDLQERLARRLAGTYRNKYQITSRGTEAERRAHLIVDYVVGMTDDFALDMYQVLEGIKVT